MKSRALTCWEKFEVKGQTSLCGHNIYCKFPPTLLFLIISVIIIFYVRSWRLILLFFLIYQIMSPDGKQTSRSMARPAALSAHTEFNCKYSSQTQPAIRCQHHHRKVLHFPHFSVSGLRNLLWFSFPLTDETGWLWEHDMWGARKCWGRWECHCWRGWLSPIHHHHLQILTEEVMTTNKTELWLAANIWFVLMTLTLD